MPDAKPSLLIATSNPGKVREFAEMLNGAGFACISLADVASLEEPEETGRTFRENACLKASYYAKATGQWSLADDSGLSVHALGDKPGVHSARWAAMHDADGNLISVESPYAGVMIDVTKTRAVLTSQISQSAPATPGQRPGPSLADTSAKAKPDRRAKDDANNALLLKQMQSHSDRSAKFVCVLALANPQGQIVLTTEDAVHGELLASPRGANGFGYDPLFFIPSLHKTTAELSPDEKHAISHRGKALRRLRQLIDSTGLLNGTPSSQEVCT